MKQDHLDHDPIDEDLKQLDRHAPSMRFAKSVVEKVAAETELIKPERNPLAWIPKLCLVGVVLALALMAVALSQEDSTFDPSQTTGLVQVLNMILTVSGSLLLFSGLDRLLRKLFVNT